MVSATSANPLPTFYKTEINDNSQTILCPEIEEFLISSKKLAEDITQVGVNALTKEDASKKLEETKAFQAKLYSYKKESPHNEHILNVEKIAQAKERILTSEKNNTFWTIALTISMVASGVLFALGCIFASVPVFSAVAITVGFTGFIAAGIALAILLTNKKNDPEDAKFILKTTDYLWNQKTPIQVSIIKQHVEPVHLMPVYPTVHHNKPSLVVVNQPHHHSHGHAKIGVVPGHSPLELHEIPGSGKKEAVRDVASTLQNVGISVAHKPDLVATVKNPHHGVPLSQQNASVVVKGPSAQVSFATTSAPSAGIPLSQQNNIPLSQQGKVGSPGVREVPGKRV